MKKRLPIILSVIFAIVMWLGAGITISKQNSALAQQATEISSIKNRIAILQTEQTNHRIELIQSTTGLNLHRVSQDDVVISDFMNLVCTWDTYAEYTHARETIMRRYGLSEDSSFMTVFMPNIPNKVDVDGTQINRIDVFEYNMMFESVSSYVTDIRVDEYTYFSIVKISSTWKNGGEAIVQAAVTYTVNANGDLSNIMAIPLLS